MSNRSVYTMGYWHSRAFESRAIRPIAASMCGLDTTCVRCLETGASERFGIRRAIGLLRSFSRVTTSLARLVDAHDSFARVKLRVGAVYRDAALTYRACATRVVGTAAVILVPITGVQVVLADVGPSRRTSRRVGAGSLRGCPRGAQWRGSFAATFCAGSWTARWVLFGDKARSAAWPRSSASCRSGARFEPSSCISRGGDRDPRSRGSLPRRDSTVLDRRPGHGDRGSLSPGHLRPELPPGSPKLLARRDDHVGGAAGRIDHRRSLAD